MAKKSKKKPTKNPKTYHNPKGGPTCGDKGGENWRGEPCEYMAGWGTEHMGKGRCVFHDDGSHDAEVQLIKDTFVYLIADPLYTTDQAANMAGRDYSTIFRWRQADPEFDEAVKKAMAQAKRGRNPLAVDTLYRRIVEERATATEVVFYLTNMSEEFSKNGRDGPEIAPEDRVEKKSAREKLVASLEGMRDRLQENGNGNGKEQKQIKEAS